jgi:hypothetical protein
MKRRFLIFTLSFILLSLFGNSEFAQAPKPAESDKPVVKVQVVLSRYEGDRKMSSLPYTMLATAGGDGVVIRTGAQVAVPSGPSNTQGADSKAVPVNWQYLDVGTNIDCNVSAPDNGRFRVRVNLSDRSVIDRQSPSAVPKALDVPSLRNFSYTNSVLLKDGETKQFVAASDKVSGDVVKIDVTLTVEK